MRLTDLEPRWLHYNGALIGFVFRSPTKPQYYQTCMFQPTARQVQREAIRSALPQAERQYVQMCNPDSRWTVTSNDFATITVQPSLDGSAGGLWHGFITNGEIVGGV